jgi:hypothetical protein
MKRHEAVSVGVAQFFYEDLWSVASFSPGLFVEISWFRAKDVRLC